MFFHHATDVIMFSNFSLLVLGRYSSRTFFYEDEFREEVGRSSSETLIDFIIFDLAVQ
jgi:hypothetical protein